MQILIAYIFGPVASIFAILLFFTFFYLPWYFRLYAVYIAETPGNCQEVMPVKEVLEGDISFATR